MAKAPHPEAATPAMVTARTPRGRESAAERQRRATAVLALFKRAYPDAHCALTHAPENALELVVATILSAQCTDARVNLVTPKLFARCRTAADYAGIPTAELESLIQSTGFFRNKAKSIRGLGNALVERHGGQVPDSMEELVKLPGVGRKTANVVLGNAFGKNEGIVVDTHVGRLAFRLRFTRATDPVKIERDLMPLFPRDDWALLAHLLISHGRAICQARKPRCVECPVHDLCPSASLERAT